MIAMKLGIIVGATVWLHTKGVDLWTVCGWKKLLVTGPEGCGCSDCGAKVTSIEVGPVTLYPTTEAA